MIPQKAASAISLLFNPAVIAAFAFLTLLCSGGAHSFLLGAICISFGTIVPLAMMYQLSKSGLISDLYVSRRGERVMPLVGAISSYLLGGGALILLRSPSIVTALMLCYAGNTIIMMVISLRWKISVHASGIAGPATVLTYSLGPWDAILFALLIPVGWARIELKAHTLGQTLAGALITIAATWLQLRFYLLIL
jgi:membrane-associated phospholipid phosphatase